MKTIQQDLKSNNLSLKEAIDLAQNRPLVCRYALLVTHTRKEEEKEEDVTRSSAIAMIFSTTAQLLIAIHC